jgi:hypothetical protein
LIKRDRPILIRRSLFILPPSPEISARMAVYWQWDGSLLAAYWQHNCWMIAT